MKTYLILLGIALGYLGALLVTEKSYGVPKAPQGLKNLRVGIKTLSKSAVAGLGSVLWIHKCIRFYSIPMISRVGIIEPGLAWITPAIKELNPMSPKKPLLLLGWSPPTS